MIQTPCEEIFGHPKGLFSRCLGVGIPTHKVFGRLGCGGVESHRLHAWDDFHTVCFVLPKKTVPRDS